jgi:glycerol kinase
MQNARCWQHQRTISIFKEVERCDQKTKMRSHPRVAVPLFFNVTQVRVIWEERENIPISLACG